MIVDHKVTALIEKAANKHLYTVMGDKGKYMIPDNFSTVQYMNPRGQIDLLKFKELVVRRLYMLEKGAAYLNMGTACGHLELANRLSNTQLSISSVEWDVQYECCADIRKIFDVQVQYKCNNVLEDDFEIFDIETYFDYVILERFFPIYRAMDHERIVKVLKKFKPYARKALVIDSDSNWTKDQWNYLVKVSEKRVKISDTWNMFVINLENIK
jgi:hypothetical protein